MVREAGSGHDGIMMGNAIAQMYARCVLGMRLGFWAGTGGSF
jgi:hypothetical protein